jgi:hypothetical protein
MSTPPLDIDINPPLWFVTVIENEQATQDARYQDNVTLYKQGLANWILANVQNRDLGLPLSAPPTPPQRVVIYATGAGTQSQYSAPVDPSLPNAVLPPAGAGAPSVPFATGAPSQDAAVMGALGQILQELADIKAAVAPKAA